MNLSSIDRFSSFDTKLVRVVPPCAVNPGARKSTRTAKQVKGRSHHVSGYYLYHLEHASLAVWLVQTITYQISDNKEGRLQC